MLPLLNNSGTSLWPERYPPHEIEVLRLTAGPNKFNAQMMLHPVNIARGRLNPSLLQVYEGDLAYVKEMNRLEICNTAMVSAAAWWDPAFGLEGGDRSVLAICYKDGKQHYWLHHLAVLMPDKLETRDMATAQCIEVARLLKNYHVPSVSLEINGLGRFLPGILRKELSRQNVPCAVREVSSRRPKDIRIMEAFDVTLATGRLHVHKDVMRTPFTTELSEWRPASKGHDDCLDAVAGALSLQPAHMGSNPVVTRHVWTKGGKVTQAGTDFPI
jgi:hypothetical protein